MTKIVQLAGGSRAAQDTFTGAVRELTVDTDGPELRLHDGSTVGGLRILGLIANNLRYQARDTDLTEIAALDKSPGFLVKRGAGDFAKRILQGTVGEIVITNGDGFSGDPAASLPSIITKALTFSNGITSAVIGDITGNVTGNLTGNVVGDVTGVVTGSLVGDVTGNAVGNHSGTFVGDVDVQGQVLLLDDGQISVAKLAETVVLTGDSRLAFPGLIAIYSGSIASIPAGWVLCDGLNNTPDLRDRFVVGAGTTYAVDETGGALSHDHSGAIASSSDGAHNHGITVDDHVLTTTEMPQHKHGAGWGGTAGDAAAAGHGTRSLTGPTQSVDTGGGATTLEAETTSEGADAAHSHTASSASTGAHTHNTTIPSASNLPPYYALAYVMKT